MKRVTISVLFIVLLLQANAQSATSVQGRTLDSNAKSSSIKRFVAASGKDEGGKQENQSDTIIITGPNGIKRRVILRATP